jgi:diguanylate cyclase (GGDEF)-like protein
MPSSQDVTGRTEATLLRSERHERRVIVGLALLLEVLQIIFAVVLSLDPAAQDRVRPARMSVFIGATFLLLALWPRLRLQTVRTISVGIIVSWFSLNAINVILTHRAITSGLLLHLVLLALFAFAWTPARWAAALVTLLYALLIAANAVSQSQDPVGVILVCPVLALVWYLSQHGWTVQTERRRVEELVDVAYTDPLTGLLNRRAGWTRLTELADLWRVRAPGLNVVMLDLDHFKAINDSVGHGRGDEVLQGVAAALQSAVSDQDVVIRWGGEEFLVLLAGQDAVQALQTTERLLTAVRTARLPGTVLVTMSAGLAALTEAGSPKDVIALADLRLYEAKATGRNRAVSVGPSETGGPVHARQGTL